MEVIEVPSLDSLVYKSYYAYSSAHKCAKEPVLVTGK